MLNERPLLAVQGPPGTGKTTLAAEIIQQILFPRGSQNLGQGSSARILITSQAHDPLNHLLRQVHKALDEDYRKKLNDSNLNRNEKRALREAWQRLKPMIIRLVPERMMRTDPESDTAKIAEEYYPSSVAAQCVDDAMKWQRNPESTLPSHVEQA